jgi:tetratricopeptide (TPR) repeat protein
MIERTGRLALVLFFLGYSFSFSQTSARRVLVEVRDASQKPIEKVKITISSAERSDLKKEYLTNKKGQAAFLLPMEIKAADFILEKEGYQRHQESIELSKARKSQEEMSYQISFVLYQANELTPTQRLQKQGVDQKALGFFEQGIELFNAGKFPEAIAQFEKSVEVKPDFLEASQNLASSYFRAGQYEKAIGAAQKALEIEPKSAQMIKLISVAHSKLGNENKAQEYQEKLKDFPDTEFSAEELYNLGVVEANKGKDGEATKYFEKAVLAKPDFGLAHYQLGLCYFRLNNLEGAKKELEKYLSLEPEGENAKTAKALLANIK